MTILIQPPMKFNVVINNDRVSTVWGKWFHTVYLTHRGAPDWSALSPSEGEVLTYTSGAWAPSAVGAISTQPLIQRSWFGI